MEQSAATRSDSSVIERADFLYRTRGSSGTVEESIRLLRAGDLSKQAYEIQWRISRAFFFVGQESIKKSSRKESHQAGAEAGRLAVTLQPESVEGRFWHGVNLALLAQVSGALKALTCVLRGRNELKEAERICAQYHGAGPLRVLARLYHKSPKLLGGSNRKSLEHYERALSIAPENSVTLLYAAELAIDDRDFNRAVALLTKLISNSNDPDWEFENRRDRAVAQQLLEDLKTRTIK